MLLILETSQLLLNEPHPTLSFRYSRLSFNSFLPPTSHYWQILQGRDHDYCKYIHTFHKRRVSGVTPNSLKITMGVRQPGFLLLSLSSKAHMNAHQPCFLPG
jgi:hypothetical protein